MTSIPGRGIIAGTAVALVIAGVLVFATLRRDDDRASPAPDAPVAAVQTTAPTPEAAPSPPAPAATAATGSPTPTPTPGPRTVNGLMIVDEVWVGRVVEPGGLRIRSAPRLEPGNVVGSVAGGTEVAVEGRVLNGQEAEPGKGAVWLIVGPSQYIYAAPGYVERVR